MTKDLFELVSQSPTEEERDQYISELEELITKREELLSSIDREPREGEKELLKQMVSWNEQMAPKLQEKLNGIKRDVRDLKKVKATSQRYENPYNHAPIDGAFIDKKN